MQPTISRETVLIDRRQPSLRWSAVLAGSLPVSLYALVQRLHLDPVNWGFDELMTSLVGHPLYLAAYLGMVFPLCLWRILRLVSRISTTASTTLPMRISTDT